VDGSSSANHGGFSFFFLLNIIQVDLHPPTVVGSTINQGPAKAAWDRYKRKLYHTSGVVFGFFFFALLFMGCRLYHTPLVFLASFFVFFLLVSLLCLVWDRYKRKLYHTSGVVC
jgi:hypothetical protein